MFVACAASCAQGPSQEWPKSFIELLPLPGHCQGPQFWGAIAWHVASCLDQTGEFCDAFRMAMMICQGDGLRNVGFPCISWVSVRLFFFQLGFAAGSTLFSGCFSTRRLEAKGLWHGDKEWLIEFRSASYCKLQHLATDLLRTFESQISEQTIS